MEKNTLKSMKFGTEKLKNVWYYYKWHILAGVLVLALIVTLAVRCSLKKDADLYVYSAGSVYFTPDAQKELSAQLEELFPSNVGTVGLITTVIGGDISVVASQKEKDELYINYTGKLATLQEFKSQMRLPNTVICFLSPSCFAEALKDGQTLRPLSEVLDTLPDGATPDGYGVKISSLAAYSSGALRGFPEDTVLCLKARSDFRSAQAYEKAVAAFVALVGAKE